MSSDEQEKFSKLMHHFSHDIKNILHNIYGFSQLLEDDHDPKYIERMQKMVMKCKDLINAYVEKIDAGDFAIPADP
ncbi:MAG: histidine kinase dimerization/phospho-acceptor domain-containing protein [Candidatus Thorarchaeota archaeon]